MKKMLQRTGFAALAALFCLASIGTLSCASTGPDLVKQEEGYFYGYGTGSSGVEASEAAKRDLISNALSATLKAKNSEALRIEVSLESSKNMELNLKPFAENKGVSNESVTYRIKAADWDKAELVRENTLRAEYLPTLASLGDRRPLAQRMVDALSILDRLSKQGLTELLTTAGPGTELISREVEAACEIETKGLHIESLIPNGFINKDTKFTLQAQDKAGKGISNLNLQALWSAPNAKNVIFNVKTDSLGNATVEYPQNEAFRNGPIGLTFMTAFQGLAPTSKAIIALDESFKNESRYQHFDDVVAYFGTGVSVKAGEFMAGALARDTRAGKKEVAHKVVTGEFIIDRYPVTNERYGMYLYLTGATDFPEYWDNSEFNKKNQPVVGVSAEDAEHYSSWLSFLLKGTFRLPSEEEWEKAARGGKEVIYPWGDENPTEGQKANFNGNGLFTGPSPVGSFATGVNALGLFDMAGNVSEWSMTSHEEATRTAKGGSWMDGPVELRISNRRDLDPLKGYADVGFRLIKVSSDESFKEKSK